jgi:hypothetical protein
VSGLQRSLQEWCGRWGPCSQWQLHRDMCKGRLKQCTVNSCRWWSCDVCQPTRMHNWDWHHGSCVGLPEVLLTGYCCVPLPPLYCPQVLFCTFSSMIGLMLATFSVVVKSGAVRLAGIE